MLVISRQYGESLCIGDAVRIKVIAIRGGRVKLAVSAPDDVAIVREELIANGARDVNARTQPAIDAADNNSEPAQTSQS